MKNIYTAKAVMLACMLLVFFIATSQSIITGKVIDAKSRQPLEAAHISEAGVETSNTTTDATGSFSLKITRSNASVVASFVGYKPITTAISEGNSNIRIELHPDALLLQDVVVLSASTSSKFTSLAKIDLELKPVKNTQELMRVVPGLLVAQHAGGGKAEQIFLRGFDCDHGTDIQVSIDGMPVNMISHAHGQGYADAHFIIPETINNIDFGCGPYYTQQGNLNTAGYVNFRTYTNLDKGRFQLEAGQYNTYRALAMLDLFKENKDKQSAYIAGEFNYTDGATINKQNFNRTNIFGKYNYAFSSRTQLSASVSSFSSKWDASGQVPTRAVEDGSIDRFGSIDPSEGGNTERYNANVSVSHRFKNNTSWNNQAYYSRYLFNLYSNFTFFLTDDVNGDEINQKESRNIFGYNTKINTNKSFGKLTIQTNYGAGFRHDVTFNSTLAHTVKRAFLNNIKKGDINEANLFGYVQKQFSIGKWLIDAGLRYDYFHFDYLDKLNTTQQPSQAKAIISPKLNVQYTFSKNIQLYVKTGKGFHSNDTRVVVANAGKEILPAAYGSDLGIILKPTKNLFINIAAWYLYLDQEFVYVGDDGNIEPSGKTRREGIDVIARYQFSNHLFANINFNYTKPRAIDIAKGQDYIPLAPTVTSTGGLFYKNKTGFNGGLSYRYIANRAANEDYSITALGYTLLDGSINYTQPKYEIGVALENILNVKWNEAQFATESRLKNEPTGSSVTELNFTPGTPFFARVKLAVFF